MLPQGGPASRQASRALDLANYGEDVLVQQRPVRLWQELPALEQPRLEPLESLHLRCCDAVLAGDHAQLPGVLPRPPAQLSALVPFPVQQAPARENGAAPQERGQEVRPVHYRQRTEHGERPEENKPDHVPRQCLAPPPATHGNLLPLARPLGRDST